MTTDVPYLFHELITVSDLKKMIVKHKNESNMGFIWNLDKKVNSCHNDLDRELGELFSTEPDPQLGNLDTCIYLIIHDHFDYMTAKSVTPMIMRELKALLLD